MKIGTSLAFIANEIRGVSPGRGRMSWAILELARDIPKESLYLGRACSPIDLGLCLVRSPHSWGCCMKILLQERKRKSGHCTPQWFIVSITEWWSWTNNHILQMEKGRLREVAGRVIEDTQSKLIVELRIEPWLPDLDAGTGWEKKKEISWRKNPYEYRIEGREV